MISNGAHTFPAVTWNSTNGGSRVRRAVVRFNLRLKVLETVPLDQRAVQATPRRPFLSSNITACANGTCLLGYYYPCFVV